VQAVAQCPKLGLPVHCSQTLKFMGTCYSKDAFVVLTKTESEMIFGKVLVCVMGDSGIGGRVVSVCQSYKAQDLGVHVIQETETIDNGDCVCVLLSELWDYCPLAGYCVNGRPHIALKHAVFDAVSEESNVSR
jgi:hypothetical protein